jgi:uncharacterized protein YndB with AHSA1/START domain
LDGGGGISVGEKVLGGMMPEETMAAKGETITVEQKFATDGGNVYDGFLDPKLARKFLFTTVGGEMVRAEIDAQVGGTYTFVERRGDVEVLHTGEYVELVRPSRIVFTFGVPQFSDAVSTVVIEIAPIGEGCVLTLTNSGLPAEWAEKTKTGWAEILLTAEKVLAD